MIYFVYCNCNGNGNIFIILQYITMVYGGIWDMGYGGSFKTIAIQWGKLLNYDGVLSIVWRKFSYNSTILLQHIAVIFNSNFNSRSSTT